MSWGRRTRGYWSQKCEVLFNNVRRWSVPRGGPSISYARRGAVPGRVVGGSFGRPELESARGAGGAGGLYWIDYPKRPGVERRDGELGAARDSCALF